MKVSFLALTALMFGITPASALTVRVFSRRTSYEGKRYSIWILTFGLSFLFLYFYRQGEDLLDLFFDTSGRRGLRKATVVTSAREHGRNLSGDSSDSNDNLSGDSSDSNDLDDDDVCPLLACGGGGAPEASVFNRLDGESPFPDTLPVTTSTVISFNECVEIIEEFFDDNDAYEVDELYITYLTTTFFSGEVASVCAASTFCPSGITSFELEPPDDGVYLLVPPENVLDDKDCSDIVDFFFETPLV